MLWYGFPIPNVTDPSVPTSGVSQAPPEPTPRARTPLPGPSTVLNVQSRRPVAALSAISTPPAAGTRAVGAGQVHPPVRHLWLDLERPLALVQQVVVHPDCLARRGAQR